MAAMAELWVLSAIAAIASWAQGVRENMNPQNSARDQLVRQIGISNAEGAKALAGSMSANDVGKALEETAGNQKASARILVLELASDYPSEGASRAILSRLHDPDLTVRSIANSQLARIAQKPLVPEMFHSMEEDLSPAVKGALARQIGLIGDGGDIPRLRKRYQATQDPVLRNDLSLAMARLGDDSAGQQLVRQLSDPAAEVRLDALRDIPYVGDPGLARYFRSVLEDRRDVLVISSPQEPKVTGRVCDFAIQALGAIGIRFSFPSAPVRRFTDAEIEQALQIVTSLEKAA
jgi:HEAT repeat protein